MATRNGAPPEAPHPADAQNEAPRRNLPVPTAPGSSPAVPIAAGETSASAIAAREKALVEAKFVYAMRNPRVFDAARLRLLKACQRPRFAETARYAKPVGTEKVYGLSIRFAEEARILWGNVDVTAMIVFDDDEKRIIRVTGTDLETNATDSVDVLVEKFVERRVLRQGMEVIGSRQNKNGDIVYRIRATEDDLLVKQNNQIAKARRNVILAVIPADIKEECEEQIVDTVRRRDAEDPDGSRKRVLDSFFVMGVMPQQVQDLLGHPLEQLTPAELTLLRTYYTALKEGEATWVDIVEQHTAAHGRRNGGGEGHTAPTAAAPARGTDALREGLKGRAAPKSAADSVAGEATAKTQSPSPASAAPEANTRPAERRCPECGQVLPSHKPGCWYELHPDQLQDRR